jgi:hypothetical protein
MEAALPGFASVIVGLSALAFGERGVERTSRSGVIEPPHEGGTLSAAPASRSIIGSSHSTLRGPL